MLGVGTNEGIVVGGRSGAPTGGRAGAKGAAEVVIDGAGASVTDGGVTGTAEKTAARADWPGCIWKNAFAICAITFGSGQEGA
jgi:hypothetical protein